MKQAEIKPVPGGPGVRCAIYTRKSTEENLELDCTPLPAVCETMPAVRQVFQRVLQEFLDYYHHKRPHQGKDNKLLTPTDSSPPSEGEVVCEQRLGGLLKHYYRQAA